MKPVLLSLVFFPLILSTVLAEEYGWYTEGDFEPTSRARITLRNTLDIERVNCPVIILRHNLPQQNLEQTWLTVVDPSLPSQARPSLEELKKSGSGAALEEMNGHYIPYQFDDLDKDGLPDELFFMIDFAPGETKIVYVYFGENWRGGVSHETHAGMGTYGRHLVPWWESKLMGWKFWYPNSTDLYGKRDPMLVANLEGSGEISGYTAPYEYGSDILSVAETFGAGGMCLFEHPDAPALVSRPRFTTENKKGPVYGPRFAYDVIVNGPLRSMVRMHTMNWQTENGSYEVEQLMTAYKDKSYSTCKVHFVQFNPERDGVRFGCGMRKIMDEYKVYQDDGIVVSMAKNLRITDPDVDPLWETEHIVDFEAIAMIVKDEFKPEYQMITDFGGNHCFRIPGNEHNTYEYLIAAGWSEGVINRTEDEFLRYILNAQDEYNNPIKVGSIEYEKKE